MGILKTDEPQYGELLKGLNNQIQDDDEVFVVENKPKNIAHDVLYSTFMSKAESFDLFIKLDADMVLNKNDFMIMVKSRFEKNQKLDWLHIYIWDDIIQEYISGLNIYRSTVKWDKNNTDNTFTDRKHRCDSISQKLVVKNPDNKWVIHCKSPSLYQLINFSTHRAIKAFQFHKKSSLRRPESIHGIIPQKLLRVWITHRSKGHAYALLAYLNILSIKPSDQFINRTSEEKKQFFDQLSQLSYNQVCAKILFNPYFYLLSIGKIGYRFLFMVLNSWGLKRPE